MKKWSDIKESITALSKEEKYTLNFMSDVVSKIIIARNEKNISQRDLAKLTEIEQSTIARIETMKTIPRIDTLIKILDVLDMQIQTIQKIS
jgi:transcriptional regulator with XRE-family HTH domain